MKFSQCRDHWCRELVFSQRAESSDEEANQQVETSLVAPGRRLSALLNPVCKNTQHHLLNLVLMHQQLIRSLGS